MAACVAQQQALLAHSSRCCCTISAWKAPRTLTGSLANMSDHSSKPRESPALKTGLWMPSRRGIWKCQVGSDAKPLYDVYSFIGLWDRLLSSIAYLPAAEIERVKAAYELAYDAHNGQKRRSGEPYIIHPVEVACILGELEVDWETLAAGLLHDTVEDTALVTFEMLEEKFGLNVRRIVEGETKVSKLGKIQCCDSESSIRDAQADDLRQMFVAMTEEVRVIIVKLADRLHNMRTLAFMPPHKQKRIALETLQIFGPLAKLLGMYKIKSELEDLSFMYAYPTDYADIKKRVDSTFKRQKEMVTEALDILLQTLKKDHLLNLVTDKIETSTRCKEPYSVYKKLTDNRKTVEEIGAIVQVRIVIHSKGGRNLQQACYHVLGLVHALWRPVPQTMKDYIATPKPNGYQSLHTKVIPFNSRTFYPIEIQIRTEEMDKLAEFGIALHYSGKQKLSLRINGTASAGFQLDQSYNSCLSATDLARRVSWLSSIREWQEEFVGNMSSREFVDTVTGDLLGSRVFVFTPKGEIKNLPKGATVIDYAYQIHTDVGNKMVAAKVNGNLVSPTHVLSNAEVVEILTYEGASNKKHFIRHQRWLRFARTRSARHKLTKFLREQAALSAIELTADAIKKFLKGDDTEGKVDGPLYSLGQLRNVRSDTSSSSACAPKLLPAQDSMMYGGGRVINGKPGKRPELLGRRGTCLVGSAASQTFADLTIPEEARPTLEAWLLSRVAMWQGLGGSVQWFIISCLDRKSLLAEVTSVLSEAGLLICACVAETDRVKGLGTLLFHIEGTTENLVEACSNIHSVEGVLNWSAGCSWRPADFGQQTA